MCVCVYMCVCARVCIVCVCARVCARVCVMCVYVLCVCLCVCVRACVCIKLLSRVISIWRMWESDLSHLNYIRTHRVMMKEAL